MVAQLEHATMTFEGEPTLPVLRFPVKDIFPKKREGQQP